MDGSGAPGPRRRPSDGGYARGAETRDRIIEAAFHVFAEEGYVGASTRRIAAEAGVTPPALQYYFDSKEGLHRACGQAIVDRVLDQLTPRLEQARQALAADETAPAADALCELIAVVAEFAMAKVESEGWSRFMNRCQSDDTGPAFEVIQREIADPLKTATIELAAKALGRSPRDPKTRLRALLILSQVAALHTNRDHTLALIGWEDFCGARLDAAKAILKDNVRRLVQP